MRHPLRLRLLRLKKTDAKRVNMTTGTLQIHRVLRTTPEKVYKAFLEADAMAKWLPPFGFTCKVDHLNPTVGGTFRMAFTNFSTGNGRPLVVSCGMRHSQ